MRSDIQKNITAILILSIIFISCSSAPKFTDDSGTSSIGDRYKTHSPDKGKNNSSELADLIPLSTESGTASYYASEFNGRKTANGETYNMNALTAAHKDFPFNTIVRVTNLENGKQILVRINDRFFEYKGRIIDLSLEAAKKLGMIQGGTAKVRLDVIKWGDK
jgi:peptidoglycan lytic transglycosylase